MNHKQLTFAREYRGYNQTELSSKIQGLSQSNLSKFEKGLGPLSDEVIDRIIEFLDFPRSFFNLKINNNTETAHFRKRASITKKERTSIQNSYRLIGHIIDQMGDSLHWPEFKLKALDLEDGYTPGYVAQYTRKLLGLGDDEPVQNIYHLLESNGIIIAELDEVMKFDGVSLLTDDGQPMIVVNKNFSNDRKRFTIAHELGHLLMHCIDHPAIPEHRDHKVIENEANNFASEFLMPAKSIRNHLYDLKLSDLAKLKSYWLTSMASIVRRARDLGCIDQNRYQYINIEFSRAGLKKNEGPEVFIDDPVLLNKGYSMHKNELAYSDQELAGAFSLPIDVIMKYLKFDRAGKARKLQVAI